MGPLERSSRVNGIRDSLAGALRAGQYGKDKIHEKSAWIIEMVQPVKRPLELNKRNDLLNCRIPDRLFELHLCATVASSLEKNRKMMAEVHTSSHVYRVEPAQALLHSSLDAAIMTCRALLNFLGIKHDSNGLKTARPDDLNDVTLEHFGLDLLTPADATGGSSEVRNALLVVLEAANRGVGHLTINPARSTARDLNQVRIACNRTIELIHKHLYDALPRKMRPTPFKKPEFKKGGYGYVSIHEQPEKT